MKKIIKLFLIVLIVFLFVECPEKISSGGGEDDDEIPATLYAIGDIGPSGVGIVFYITNGGLHGLEAATSDQSIGEAWITGGATQITFNGNTLTGIGTGLANSNAIIAQTGHTSSAAKLCRDYRGGGKNDWFLPSRDELDELYVQRVIVGVFLDFYWSSSERDATSAWRKHFGGGIPLNYNKTNINHVRAIRAF